jgi:uncharacterized protein YqgC (DUF456 family)
MLMTRERLNNMAFNVHCSSYGTWECALGTIVGALFFPVGIMLGPFFGAFIGELMARREVSQALRGGFGAFLGFLAGTLLNLCFCIYLICHVVLDMSCRIGFYRMRIIL